MITPVIEEEAKTSSSFSNPFPQNAFSDSFTNEESSPIAAPIFSNDLADKGKENTPFKKRFKKLNSGQKAAELRESIKQKLKGQELKKKVI